LASAKKASRDNDSVEAALPAISARVASFEWDSLPNKRDSDNFRLPEDVMLAYVLQLAPYEGGRSFALQIQE
jgi:hypothetical protein